ncbi:hypothetical protein EV702DRAFT_1278054 [Suillus placidus]|uniref:F-box domain-containing protein n=1 Tax=Suillus placidus TaxID=48579 RepID=A0A9P6ZY66_9AGAM|nr:hypothetical protein EV702DRAFT_1278054 [Suillus placidus]
MHQALLVSEILREILAHTDQIARKSTAALAATCKAFHEPAMDLLWAEMYQLEPLLGCVTRLHPLIDWSGRIYHSAWAINVEPLSAHEARQFLRHSTRVRSLEMSSYRLLKLLSVIPIETCIFPRLRSLTWNLFTVKYFDLFLPHTLRQCYILSLKQLQSVVTRCAALELLSIQNSDTSTADELSLLSDRVRLCKHLVTLSCPTLNWAAWKHLSNLPTLLTVSIVEARIAPPWSLEQGIINFSPFLNVTALSFRLHSAAYSMTILHHSQFPSLKEFEINLNVLSSAEAEQLFRALSHCKACQTLEKITITLNDKYQPPLGNSLTVIPHLLCFTQLQTLRLTCGDTFIYLDDDLLLEAISTWPHIRTLEIEDSGLRSSPVTFRALFTALRLRPQLHSLRVAISTVNINDIDTNAEPIQHSSLETLQLETSEFLVADPEAVARIIFTWFPCINYVFGSTDDREDRRDEVNKHLRSLKAAALHVTGAASNT